ncbi:hypothetical protein [Gracilimonas tropica]|uniref:hypothetical protein n=1 Tax=Gracilimonas tropica TaxID=454600 RepID=UPI0012F898CC|nr:hypothetical protein [Gracilimonas tropica]
MSSRPKWSDPENSGECNAAEISAYVDKGRERAKNGINANTADISTPFSRPVGALSLRSI